MTYSSHNMKVEISGDEIAQRIIHDLAFGIEQLSMEVQQHITALNFHRLCHIGCGTDGADVGAGRGQRIAATQQKVQHRAVKVCGQVFSVQNIFRQSIHKISDWAAIGTDDPANAGKFCTDGDIQERRHVFISHSRLDIQIAD